jgi:hypothetical protein
MKLLDARVNGNPRQVSTKYGEKSVLDVSTSEGEFTIWRPAGDKDVMGRMNGERVSIALDSKGKASLVEHCSTVPQQAAQTQRMGFTAEPAPETSRSAEIIDYVDRLGKLYNRCLMVADDLPCGSEFEPADRRAVATTLFIQTIKKFDL